jgi:hypothetical protein
MADLNLPLSRLAECPRCEGRHTHGSGRPNGVDCRCGRHFHFGDEMWIRTDECIACPSCGRALSPLDFGQDGIERQRAEWNGERWVEVGYAA